MLDKKLKVKEIRDLGARNYLLTLISPEQARLTRPGQFVMVKCSGDVQDLPLSSGLIGKFQFSQAVSRHAGSIPVARYWSGAISSRFRQVKPRPE